MNWIVAQPFPEMSAFNLVFIPGSGLYVRLLLVSSSAWRLPLLARLFSYDHGPGGRDALRQL